MLIGYYRIITMYRMKKLTKTNKPDPEIGFISFSPIYGYQISMYSNNVGNSLGLPRLNNLKITHWYELPTLPDEHDILIT